jgi:putative sigma-54 modulation protein
MRLVLTGRHVDITPGIRRLVDRKLARLERVFGNSIISAQIVLTLEKQRHSADVTVHLRGDHMLNGRTNGATWTAALSPAIEKIQRQGEKVKGKWAERKRKGSTARAVVLPAAAAPATAASNGPRVVRLVRTQFKPMSLESAAIELRASGEAFLLFRNLETDGLSVLLRRRSDEFGLVEPER